MTMIIVKRQPFFSSSTAVALFDTFHVDLEIDSFFSVKNAGLRSLKEH